MSKTDDAMDFKHGSPRTHYFVIPRSDYVVGAKLWFTAKPAADNDNTDSAAVINKQFGDADVILSATDATYTLQFVPTDVTVTFAVGETKKKFKGEFTYLASDNTPLDVWPADDDYIPVVVYNDIKRAA